MKGGFALTQTGGGEGRNGQVSRRERRENAGRARPSRAWKSGRWGAGGSERTQGNTAFCTALSVALKATAPHEDLLFIVDVVASNPA